MKRIITIALVAVATTACGLQPKAPPLSDGKSDSPRSPAEAPKPVGSPERPYPDGRLAAVHVAKVALNAYEYRDARSEGSTLRVAIKADSPELGDAVRGVLSDAGVRQSVSGPWLDDVLKTQNPVAYTSAAREGVARSDLILHIAETPVTPGLTIVRGALLTVRTSELSGERYLAREVVVNSVSLVYVKPPAAPEPSIRLPYLNEALWGEGIWPPKQLGPRWVLDNFLVDFFNAKDALNRARSTGDGSVPINLIDDVIQAYAALYRSILDRREPLKNLFGSQEVYEKWLEEVGLK